MEEYNEYEVAYEEINKLVQEDEGDSNNEDSEIKSIENSAIIITIS